MKKLFIILATAALAASCLNPNTPTERTFETDSTVNAYFKFIRKEEGKLPLHTIMVADATIEELLIMLSLVGNNLGSIYDVMDNPNGDKAKAFLAAQEKFGDHNPNKSLFRFYENKKGGEWQLESGQCIYYAFGEQISKITITSSRDWAPGYPAGTDLAPLFNAEYGALSRAVMTRSHILFTEAFWASLQQRTLRQCSRATGTSTEAQIWPSTLLHFRLTTTTIL